MNDPVKRVIDDLSAELGQLSSALFLFGQCEEEGDEIALKLAQEIGRNLPVFHALVHSGLSPNTLRQQLKTQVTNLGDLLEGVDTVVVTSLEADLLDEIACQFPALRIRAVCHDQAADRRRIESNYSASDFQVIDADQFDQFAHPTRSVLLIPGFYMEIPSDDIFTYHTSARILGQDTRSMFDNIVTIDLIGRALHFYPHRLTRVSADEFSEIRWVPDPASSP